MITNLFKQLVTASLAGSTFTAPSHIAWGDSSTAATEDDTVLGNELERNAIDTNIVTGTTIEITSTLTTAELVGSTIKEVGLLNASSSGTLFMRNTFNDIEKTSGFEVDSTFIITVR